MLIGNGPTDLHRITMIGNDLSLDTGIGPAARTARAPVCVGQPTLRDWKRSRLRNGPSVHRKADIRSQASSARAQAVQLAAIVAVVFVAKGAIAEPFYVPSGSMEPTP